MELPLEMDPIAFGRELLAETGVVATEIMLEMPLQVPQ